MYIDEKLIKILEPHLGETIDVSYAITLIKTIAKEHETEQLLIQRVSKCRHDKDCITDKDGFEVCPDCGEWGENC